MDNFNFKPMPQSDREFDWNDTIENDGGFTLLEPGEYDFNVVNFERGRHPGSEKLPPCNKAILTIDVSSRDGRHVEIRHNLFLHTKCEGMLCAFFASIGQRKHGERLAMNWNAVIGARGRCKVTIREWTGSDGNVRQSNEIKSFLEPKVAPKASFTPGEF